jgi:hypothetical protein
MAGTVPGHDGNCGVTYAILCPVMAITHAAARIAAAAMIRH